MLLGLSVASEAQGQGVGAALMQALVDYADRWAQVLRLELTGVLPTTRARSRCTASSASRWRAPTARTRLRDGAYVDALAMARLHPNPAAWLLGRSWYGPPGLRHLRCPPWNNASILRDGTWCWAFRAASPATSRPTWCASWTQAGATVQVVMTEAAAQFITPVTLQALSNRPSTPSQWDAREANNMAHINLTREADAVLVAPASADFLAQLAQGRANDLLALLCLARPIERCPLLVAPAMNREMWAHPATQRNVAQCVADGAVVLGPAAGDQACGEIGDGRMLEAQELCEALVAFFQPKVLAGRRVLITAGPTFEPIDPVRGITNLSSGKMGFAIARAAAEAGADVTLVAGPVHLPTPLGVARVDVQTARQMHDAVLPQAGGARRVRRHRRGGRLAPRDAVGLQDQEDRRREVAAAFRAHREPGHPRRRREAAEGPVLRGLRGREPRPLAPCAREARAKERAADGGQPRPGHLRPRRQCPAARRRARRTADPSADKLSLARELVREIARRLTP
jgi:phosphopantothenoylcysteine decarboxylase/phosphopantothenate--cysteine ligase